MGAGYHSPQVRTHAKAAREGLFVQLVMLAQLGGYRVGHYLAAMDFGGLAPVNSGMPTRVRVAVNGHPEIAGADPLLHDLFKLGRPLSLLIHAALARRQASPVLRPKRATPLSFF
jgi:hypothetical protein